ncbi:MAG: hypothetical protein JWP69_1339 [Flaviaesturariibacter sp.]|nr:hypothetical protein [Flaviaesturariibacter sp.]
MSENQTLPRPNLIEYQSHLKELVNKSQESFEKQLSYISAGSLSISMGFIKNVVGELSKSKYEGFIIGSWSLMGVTLLINLLSHVFTSNCHNKTIEEIGDGQYDYINALCRHNDIKKLNYVSIATLILGIAFLLIFISLNI